MGCSSKAPLGRLLYRALFKIAPEWHSQKVSGSIPLISTIALSAKRVLSLASKPEKGLFCFRFSLIFPQAPILSHSVSGLFSGILPETNIFSKKLQSAILQSMSD